MKIRAKNIYQEMQVMRWAMMIFFAVIVANVALVPHIFKGYSIGSFEIAEDYEQSIVIVAESLLMILLYRMYSKKMYALRAEHEETENNLKNSYKHIGKINNELELLRNFIAAYPSNSINKIGEKNLYEKLLSYMLVSVARTNHGFVRFINIQTGKTLKEVHYPGGEDQSSNIKLSNALIASGEINNASENNVEVVESYYHESPIKCVLCFPKKEKNFDRSLLQLLLTHIHLIFLASRSYAVA